jgi:purine-binding chemotaxis protein CheW
MTNTDGFRSGYADYVTFTVGEQLFGVPVLEVQDVFKPQAITRVPLAPAEIAGVLNLRGRIVTAIDVRARLGVTPGGEGHTPMAISVERDGESYGLLIDRIGDVLSLPVESFESNPSNLDARWRSVSKGVYRLDRKLLVVLDIDRVLCLERAAA